MAILAYGVNYRTAPIDVREQIAITEERLSEALSHARGSIPSLSEAAILSTCNRTELYLALDPTEEARVAQWLAEYRSVAPAAFTDLAYSYWDQEAARHLIRVAAGLDSQVLGEPQILGQVKTAYDIARQAGTLGPELNLLSQVTLSTAKKVRTNTGIGRNPVSVAYAAVVMAQQIFSSLKNTRALLLGAGDTIERVAEHLSEAGVKGIAIANRTLANAEKLATRFDAQPMQLTDVGAVLHQFDIVIASTGSSLPVVGKGAVEHAIKQRRHKPIFIVDIAVPRDVEPEVSELRDVYLYTVDDLTDIIEANLRQRHEAAETAESLVQDGAAHYIRERRAQQSQGLLVNFRERADTLREAELKKAMKDLESGTAPDLVLANLSRSLTNKLIHAPTAAIREASADGHTDLLDYLKTLYKLE